MNIYFFSLILLFTACKKEGDSKVNEKMSKQLKMEKIELHENFITYELPVKIKSRKNKCYLGDKDQILEYVRKTKSKIIFTVERLDQRDFVLFAQQMNVEQAMFKVKSSYFQNYKNIEGLYGVYVCSNDDNSNSCRNKKSYPFVDFANYIFSDKGDLKKLKQEKIFFYRALYIDKNSDLHIIGSKDVEEYTKKLEGGKISGKRKKQLIEIQKNVGSLPLEVDNNQLVLNLPELDDGCNTLEIFDYLKKQNPPVLN